MYRYSWDNYWHVCRSTCSSLRQFQVSSPQNAPSRPSRSSGVGSQRSLARCCTPAGITLRRPQATARNHPAAYLRLGRPRTNASRRPGATARNHPAAYLRLGRPRTNASRRPGATARNHPAAYLRLGRPRTNAPRRPGATTRNHPAASTRAHRSAGPRERESRSRDIGSRSTVRILMRGGRKCPRWWCTTRKAAIALAHTLTDSQAPTAGRSGALITRPSSFLRPIAAFLRGGSDT